MFSISKKIKRTKRMANMHGEIIGSIHNFV